MFASEADDSIGDVSRDPPSPALASDCGFLRQASIDAFRHVRDEATRRNSTASTALSTDSNHTLFHNLVHLRREQDFQQPLRGGSMCNADPLCKCIQCTMRKEFESSTLTQKLLAESVVKLKDELTLYADSAIEKMQRELTQKQEVIRQELGITAAEKAAEHYDSLQAFVSRLSHKVAMLERNQTSDCLRVDPGADYAELRSQVATLAAEVATTRETYSKLQSQQLFSTRASDSCHAFSIQHHARQDRFDDMQREISRLSEIVAMCAASSANAASAVTSAIQQTEANIIRQELSELRREVPALRAIFKGCASVAECDVLQEWCRALHKELSSKHEELLLMCHETQGQGTRCVCPDPARLKHDYEHVQQVFSEQCRSLQDQLKDSLLRHERTSHKLDVVEASLENCCYDYQRLCEMTTAQPGALLRYVDVAREDANKTEAALVSVQGKCTGQLEATMNAAAWEPRLEYHRLEEMLSAQSNALLRHEESAHTQDYQRLEVMVAAQSSALLSYEEDAAAEFLALQQDREVAQSEATRVEAALKSRLEEMSNAESTALRRHEDAAQEEWRNVEALLSARHNDHEQFKEMAAKRASRTSMSGVGGASAASAAAPVEDITSLVSDMEEIMEDFRDEIRKTCHEQKREHESALSEMRGELRNNFKCRLDTYKDELSEARGVLENYEQEVSELRRDHEQDMADLRKEVQDLDSEQAIEIEELRQGMISATGKHADDKDGDSKAGNPADDKDDDFRCKAVAGETPQQRITRVMNMYLSKLNQQNVPLPEITQIQLCGEHPDCFHYMFGSRKLHIFWREKDNEIELHTRCGGGSLTFDHFAKRNGRKEKSLEDKKNSAKSKDNKGKTVMKSVVGLKRLVSSGQPH